MPVTAPAEEPSLIHAPVNERHRLAAARRCPAAYRSRGCALFRGHTLTEVDVADSKTKAPRDRRSGNV
jgi:hypothetical protein